MNRITDYKKLAEDITTWIRDYATSNNIKSLVVGVSGGIDSAVVSTLCAMTGLPTHCFILDIYSDHNHIDLARDHVYNIHERVSSIVFVGTKSLVTAFETLSDVQNISSHALANTKSRLRMVYLYQMASHLEGIVVGTGNKVEDFGVGFFTKHGDGGVDISPIADLYKTEVRELGRYLGVSQEIIDAEPTDGLWGEHQKTDEQCLGATYEELEWAMEVPCKRFAGSHDTYTKRQMEVIRIYEKLHGQNQHKMLPIPIYKLII